MSNDDKRTIIEYVYFRAFENRSLDNCVADGFAKWIELAGTVASEEEVEELAALIGIARDRAKGVCK